MTIAQNLLPEFDVENGTTRKMLLLVRDTDKDFKPHSKSWNLGELATHIVSIYSWTGGTLTQTEMDIAPVGKEPPKCAPFSTAAHLMATFEKNVVEARAALAGTSDADIMVPWTLKKSGAALFSHPRLVILRGFVISHIIHHRAQMSVYFRLLNIPLPQEYGPTADNPTM